MITIPNRIHQVQHYYYTALWGGIIVMLYLVELWFGGIVITSLGKRELFLFLLRIYCPVTPMVVPLFRFFFIYASVALYWAFVLSLFVPNLCFFLWPEKAVLRDCGISRVYSLIFLFLALLKYGLILQFSIVTLQEPNTMTSMRFQLQRKLWLWRRKSDTYHSLGEFSKRRIDHIFFIFPQ